jgi:type 2 lantibiotic biosynthesis protein LanM
VERASCLPRDEHVPPTEAARARLERWKSQRPFAAGDWLPRRLSQDGLDVSTLERTLSLPAPELMRRAPRPDWLDKIETAFARAPSLDAPRASASVDTDPAGSFLNLLQPLLEAARAQLGVALATVSGRPPIDVDRMIEQFMAAMSDRALGAIERALVLELHIAKAEGRLSGDTPEARFRSFASLLATRDQAASLLSMYPVLARSVASSIDDGVAAAIEFVERLVEDWADIRRVLFEDGDPGCVVELDTHAGDPHRRGRTVVICRFESGARLVYKPRPLDADAHFQELLKFLNDRIDAPPFRTVALLPRGEYGWMEFIDARPCRSREEASRYYRRAGGLLAVLHALRGVDCHFENIIAHGEEPVLVDLETILHPAIPHQESTRFDRRLAGRILTQSVLRVGLLPVPFGGDDPARAIDLSGMASVEGAMTPDRVLQWEKRGTDEMRVVRERVEMPGAENRAFLDDQPLSAVDFRDDIAEGFASLYRAMVRERDALLAPDGPLQRFGHDTVRVVIRATRAYGMLLSESLHPDLLRDALDRDRFFDRLWVGVDEHPALARIVGAEHRDLRRSDIPYFTCRPSERHVWTSDGERIEDFFERASLDLVEERIRGMNEADLARQLWMVTLSLGSLAAMTDEGTAPAMSLQPPRADESVLKARVLAEATRIGDRLAEIAVHDGDCAAWVTLEFREQRWLMEPVSNDLYVGLPGVALFLAHLARVERSYAMPGADAHEALARAAVHTIVRTMTESELSSVGAFSGWGGVLYGLTHVASLWNDADIRRACDQVVARIDDLAPRDEEVDLVGGTAGAIAALCAAHDAGVSDRALAAAVRAGDLLLSRAREVENGRWWSTRLAGDVPSTGFSHGNAGIGWALLRLGRASREERFERGGLGAIRFERERLRELERPSGFAIPTAARDHERGLIATWCYGGPGIGISRLHALEHAADRDERNLLRADLVHAIESTLENGFGRNHCLCHGDLGSLDFLMLVRGSREPVVPLALHIQGAAESVAESIARHGWLCGTPAHVPSPGIMNGLAGIGYGLLRYVDPVHVPSILALEAPTKKVM